MFQGGEGTAGGRHRGRQCRRGSVQRVAVTLRQRLPPGSAKVGERQERQVDALAVLEAGLGAGTQRGLDLALLKDIKEVRRGRVDDYANEVSTASFVAGESIWETDDLSLTRRSGRVRMDAPGPS